MFTKDIVLRKRFTDIKTKGVLFFSLKKKRELRKGEVKYNGQKEQSAIKN
jgi:hypothetical protein